MDKKFVYYKMYIKHGYNMKQNNGHGSHCNDFQTTLLSCKFVNYICTFVVPIQVFLFMLKDIESNIYKAYELWGSIKLK